MVRARQYFLLDAASAALAFSFHRVSNSGDIRLGLVTNYFPQVPYFYPILILQQWQHIFYFSTWDKSPAAKVEISFYLSKIIIVVSRESYHGQVLIGTGADGISWILCSKLPLICLSMWPIRMLNTRVIVVFQFPNLQLFPWISSGPPCSDIRNYCVPDPLLWHNTEQVSQTNLQKSRDKVCILLVRQRGPLLTRSLAGFWKE